MTLVMMIVMMMGDTRGVAAPKHQGQTTSKDSQMLKFEDLFVV